MSRLPTPRYRLYAIRLAILALSCALGITVCPAQSRDALSSDGLAWLRTAILSGRTDLRWPDFTDYANDVAKFYESNGYSLWWVAAMEPTPQARQLVALLQRADRKGLSPDDYDGSRWRARLDKLKPVTRSPLEEDAAKFDLALTVCAMRYISDLHIGRVNPTRVAFAFDVQSKKYDLPEFLKDHIARADDVAAALSDVEPLYPGYRRTIQALQRYLELGGKDDGEQLPPPASASKKAIVSGDSYSGVPRLVRLLRLLGDLPADVTIPPDSVAYEGPIVEAVENFQRRHGRDPSGRIDRQTLAELNVPLSHRIQQMQWTLERWRWLPAECPTPIIVVNIPEFQLRGYDKHFSVGVTMKVVVGRSYGHKTPVFSSTMSDIVFRPYWQVPESIVRSEMIPVLRKDPEHLPEYLTIGNFELTDSQGNVVATGHDSGKTLDRLRAGKLLIRQKPGPSNALGLVKFVFANSYNVYLHDTPVVGSFAVPRRDFSHGCIRLEKPAELAAWVLRDNAGWTPGRIRAAMNDSVSQLVPLAHPIPVAILYGTVVVLEDGVVRFYDDIYGHDAALQRMLAKEYPYPD